MKYNNKKCTNWIKYLNNNLLIKILLAQTLITFSSCQTTRQFSKHDTEFRKQSIINEEKGDYFVGRRYYLPKTGLWGYVRKPGKGWENAKLVIMNENSVTSPDSLIRINKKNIKHGQDHNWEYHIKGTLTKNKIYVPNANCIVNEFIPFDFRLINKKPGYLFQPNEKYHPKKIPKY